MLDIIANRVRPLSGIMTATLFLIAGPAFAVGPVPSDSELAAWTDQTLSDAISQHRASGIAVAVVRNGSVLYSKGYGYADLERKVPVEPGKTPFSLGSITKCFTATAIAQLLERGVIHSLDDPANTYLRRIKLPRHDGREVTVRNLITHRAGIDESIYGLATPASVAVPISASAILDRLPPIVRTPGEHSVYSNIGYGVLGVLIEDATGLTFGEYLHRNVFVPVNMSRSFIRYDPSQPIAQPVEFGAKNEANPIPQGWAYHPFISPSASLVSTADDMALFALAHLNAEQGNAPGLMNAATAHLMHDRGIANAPYVTGFGMSFIANTWNGTRVTENAGSGPGFQALFILLPDLQTAFVVLIMGGSEDSLHMFALREGFLNFYLHPLEPVHGPSAGVSLDQYAGVYQSERRPHSTSEAVYAVGTTLDVKLDGHESLTINGERGYREIAPGTFWKVGVTPYVPDDASSDMYVFVTDPGGKVSFVTPYLSVDIYRPILIHPKTIQTISLILCAVCGSGILALFWSRPARKRRTLQVLAACMGVLALGVPVVLAASLAQFGSYITMIGFGNVMPLKLASGMATLFMLLNAIFLVMALRDRRNPAYVGVPRMTIANWHIAALAIAGPVLVLAFFHYNLIGDHVP